VRFLPAVVLLFAVIPLAQASASDLAPTGTRLLFAQPNASDPAPILLKPRRPFIKPTHAELVERGNDGWAAIKFIDGSGIRLRGADFVVVDSELELDRAERQKVTRSSLDVQLALIKDVIHRAGAQPQRLFSAPESSLDDHRNSGEAKSGQELPDLNLFYELRFPGKQTSDVVEVIDALNQFDLIEYAAPRIKLAPPPASDIAPPTPILTPGQGYFAAAPGGIDVGYARLLPGGRGESVRVIDVERGWIMDHEDFPSIVSFTGYSEPVSRNHGAAVIGEIAAVENSYGVTGIAPSVEIGLASAAVYPSGSALPSAISDALNASRSGDIILIEQQVSYSQTDTSSCPPEWDNGVLSVVQISTANGRIVIETAGNGAQNLDDTSRFGTRFNRNIEDSAAIYVGAGSPTAHTARTDTNYGSRLDAQGWGDFIVTLGYGDLFFPEGDVRQSYTSAFGGTSGASPIVTGAASILQAIRRARGLPDLTSQQMRSALVVGATPQGAGVTIGPLPNLRNAIAAIPLTPPVITATGSASGTVTIAWNALAGMSGYKVFRKDSHAATWNLVGTTGATQFADGLIPNRTYLYRVHTFDAAGNESGDSNLDLATTVDYADPHLSPAMPVRAQHIIGVRSAVNAICMYAGTTVCPSLPFTGAALDEAQVRTNVIAAADFTAVQNQIISLRSAIGAAAATFRELPVSGSLVRVIHMEDLRTGAN
jgi:hypothetical protein